MKVFSFLLTTLLCLAFALIPEIVMYSLYGAINPVGELSKIVILAIFWFGGSGLSILFAFLGFAVWCAIISKL